MQTATSNPMDIPTLNYGNKSSASRAGKKHADRMGINHSKVNTNEDEEGRWGYTFEPEFVAPSIFADSDAAEEKDLDFNEPVELESEEEAKAEMDYNEIEANLELDVDPENAPDEDLAQSLMESAADNSVDGILRKSVVVSPCKMVWDIAEKMDGSKRSEIVAACVEAGIAKNTAKTQYQQYFTAKRKCMAP